MPRYLLDTGILSAYLRGRPRITALVDPWVAQGEAVTSIVVYGEIVEYLLSLPDITQRLLELQEVMRDIIPLPLDYPIMQRYAEIRRLMRPPQGTGLIGDIDTLIAATVTVHGLTLITADTDYQRIPQLSVQLLERSWLKG